MITSMKMVMLMLLVIIFIMIIVVIHRQGALTEHFGDDDGLVFGHVFSFDGVVGRLDPVLQVD